MGRTATKNKNLPIRMRARPRGNKVWYYYDAGGKPRKEIPLGSEYIEAIRKWTELEQSEVKPGLLITFRQVAERYTREVIPAKAPKTQQGNLLELANLYKFFDDPPCLLENIEPQHIRMYLDWRGKEAKTRANREKALFSHIWNNARQWGYTAKANPCQGVKGFKEEGRDVYVTEEEYQLVWEHAEQPMRDFMDLIYLTGQRPADALKMSETDLKDGVLWIQQNKTGTKLRVSIEGELKVLIDSILSRKKQYKVRSLKLLINEDGTPMSMSAARSKFDRARDKAGGVTWQMRDLRAKAGTDKEMSEGMAAAKDLLAHANESMTRHYVRHRVGKLVKPTK